MSRKRTLLDNFSIEENEKSDNIKKTKYSMKKLQPTKTEAEKPITHLKKVKKTKSCERSTSNTSETCIGNNDDITPDSALVTSISESNASKTPAESSLKLPKKKITSITKKPVIRNVNNDDIVKNLEKNDTAAPSKSTKLKTSKSISPIKVKFALNNVNYKNKSAEYLGSSATLKNLKRKGCVKPVKNKLTKNNVNKNESLDQVEKISNLVTLKTPKTKTSKSVTPTKKKSVSYNGNKDGGPSKVLEISNDLVTENTSKNKKSKSVSPIKKKDGLSGINKNGTSDELEENSPSKITRNRSRPILNKSPSQNLNEYFLNNCVVDLDEYKKAIVSIKRCESQSSAELDEKSMMLRSNKPPKIKKKWSDKWSGNKSSNCMLKLNVEDQSSTAKIEINNCDNMIKKPIKIQKSKSSNCKETKTKTMEKLNIDDSLSVNTSNTCDVVENKTAKFPKLMDIKIVLNSNDFFVNVPSISSNDDIIEPCESNTIEQQPVIVPSVSKNADVINHPESNKIEPQPIIVPSVSKNADVMNPPESNKIEPQPIIVPSVSKNDDVMNHSESNNIEPQPVIVPSENDAIMAPSENDDIIVPSKSNVIDPQPFTVTSENDTIMAPSENNGIELQSLNCSKLLHLATVTTTLTSLPTSASLPSTSTTVTEVPDIVSGNENNLNSPLVIFEPTSNSSYLPVPESEISYGISILSEAISRQCNESMNNSTKTMSVEQNSNEIKSPPKKTDSSTSHAKVQSPKIKKIKLRKTFKRINENHKQSVESESQSRIDREISLLSKRFDIPIDTLYKLTVEEPLVEFKKKYSALACPSMITVSPVIKYSENNTKDHITGIRDIQYKIDPIRESKAYEKSNLIDVMAELSKTMPAWSLSIVPNPSRYVISHMSINKYGVPLANKCIVLDHFFRASVFINQCLLHEYCRRCTTATEIVNLIKDLNSL